MPEEEAAQPVEDTLDVDHLADLANLPLDDGEERERMREACREVLEAFEITGVDEPEDETRSVPTFADEPEAWDTEEIEAIVEAFPDRDGRLLQA